MLIFCALRITVVKDLPKVAHQLGVLTLLLLGEMRELLDLIGSDQI